MPIMTLKTILEMIKNGVSISDDKAVRIKVDNFILAVRRGEIGNKITQFKRGNNYIVINLTGGHMCPGILCSKFIVNTIKNKDNKYEVDICSEEKARNMI